MSLQELLREKPIEQLRQVQRDLEQEHRDKTSARREDIGSHHEDIVKLASDIVSLRQLVGNLRYDLNLARESPQQTKITEDGYSDDAMISQGSRDAVDTVVQRLLVLADQFFVNKKFGSAALAMYFCESLVPNDCPRIELRKRRLDRTIKLWQNSAVAEPSQDLFQAAIILWKLNPTQLMENFAAIREEQIVQSVKTDFPSALTLLDTTLVVLGHLSSDLVRSRLSKRRLIDSIEFSTLGLQSFEAFLPPHVRELRIFPHACYEHSNNEETTSISEKFISRVLPYFNSAFSGICENSTMPSSLATVMIEIVQRMWDSSEPDYFAGLLRDILDIFFKRFRGFIEAGAVDALTPQEKAEPKPTDELIIVSRQASLRYGPFITLIDACDLWKNTLLGTQRALLQLKSSSRQVARISPELAKSLTDFVEECFRKFKETTGSVYKEQYIKWSSQDLSDASLEQALAVRMALSRLNQGFEELGGEPLSQSEELEDTIVDKLGSLNNSPQGIFCLGRRLDMLLEGNPWPAGLVERLRARLAAAQDVLLSDDSASLNDKEKNNEIDQVSAEAFGIDYSRSWLLLSPIAQDQ